MVTDPDGHGRATGRWASRREGPRLEVEALINGRLARGNLRLILHDLGFGGFAVESPIAFTPGTRHDFRFITEGDTLVAVTAETVYCRPSAMQDGMAYHLSGFRFVQTTEDGERAIAVLIDAALAPLSFSR